MERVFKLKKILDCLNLLEIKIFDRYYHLTVPFSFLVETGRY